WNGPGPRAAERGAPAAPRPGAGWPACRYRGQGLTFPDHLERLGVLCLAVPRPVERGRGDLVGLQERPHLVLAGERPDRPQLAAELIVDRDEVRRPEVDRRRRRLEAVDLADPPRRGHRGEVGVAVV